MRIAAALLIATVTATLSGCVAAAPARAPASPACAAGDESRAVARVFFGRNVGDRLGVSEAAWTAFLDAEVTPRFPDGLTVQDARGQWRDTRTGRIVREPSKVLTVILADEARGRAAVAAVAEAYKKRFRQQGVGIVIERSCVSF